MNVRPLHPIWIAFLCGILLFSLAGCGTSAAPRFYTLSPMAPSAPSTPPVDSKGDKPATMIGLGPLEIPDYLDHAQIVTRTGKNEVGLSELDLWGGSLKEDVARVLLENLSLLLDPSEIKVVLWKSYIPCAFRIPVTILRMDASPGRSLFLKARWAVTVKDLTRLGPVREFNLNRPLKGSTTEETVAAMSESLEAMARQMAADVKQFTSAATK